MNRNMLTRRLGASLLVLRQNKNDATEEDWNDFLQFLSHNRGQLEQLRLLVLTDGGIPTAAQRKRLAETLEASPAKRILRRRVLLSEPVRIARKASHR